MQEMSPELSETIEKLKKEKRIIAKKLLELSNSFKSTIARIERNFEEKMTHYENKLANLENRRVEDQTSINNQVVKVSETVNEDIEGLKKNEIQLCDDVTNLEAEHKQVTSKINLIDNTLAAIKRNIEVLEKKDDNENETIEKERRKLCTFNDKGFCRNSDQNCPFFHADLVCELYESTGICWKQNCRQRHPKICRYGYRCFRGASCRYLHRTSSCGRCEQFSPNCYYCEFCRKSFCGNCTVDKAHCENIYTTENLQHPKCENIHH